MCGNKRKDWFVIKIDGEEKRCKIKSPGSLRKACIANWVGIGSGNNVGQFFGFKVFVVLWSYDVVKRGAETLRSD